MRFELGHGAVRATKVAMCVLFLGACSARNRGATNPAPNPPASAAKSGLGGASRCSDLEPLLGPLRRGRWIAGCAVALVDARHTDVCGFGQARAGVAATPDTLFEIGSLTKLFTGLSLATMVEQGSARLDEPLSALLPPGAQVATNGRPITLLDLATHRSGLPRLPESMHPTDPSNPYADYDSARLFASLSQIEPRPAGERMMYSNFGAAVLGQALAQRARKPYVELVREEVIAPLGMTDTYFAVPESVAVRRAEGHDADDTPIAAWDFDAFAPAGGLHSSARDMARFVRAALFVSTSSLSRAFQLAEAPRADADAGRRIGLFFQTRPDGSVWHNGQTGGFSSYFAFDRQRQFGVAVLLSTAFTRTGELGDRVLAFAEGKPLAPLDLPSDYAQPAERLRSYEGEYLLSDGFVIRIFLSPDGLRAQATGQRAFRIFASAPDRFYMRGIDARIEFERDAGATTALILDQAGKRQRAPRRAR